MRAVCYLGRKNPSAVWETTTKGAWNLNAINLCKVLSNPLLKVVKCKMLF